MLVQYKITDEVFGRAPDVSQTKTVQLKLVSSTLTAREIIAEKARSYYESMKGDDEAGLTRLDVAARLYREADLPGSVDAAIANTLEAFRKNRYVLFWNNEQVASLDQRLQILGENDARFVRLIPLKGG